MWHHSSLTIWTWIRRTGSSYTPTIPSDIRRTHRKSSFLPNPTVSGSFFCLFISSFSGIPMCVNLSSKWQVLIIDLVLNNYLNYFFCSCLQCPLPPRMLCESRTMRNSLRSNGRNRHRAEVSVWPLLVIQAGKTIRESWRATLSFGVAPTETSSSVSISSIRRRFCPRLPR